MLLFGHVGAGGQAKTCLEKAIAYAVPDESSVKKQGLKMHRFPDRSGLTVPGFKGQAQLVNGTVVGWEI